VTPEQAKFIEEHRQGMTINSFTLWHGVPPGSTVIIGRGLKSGRVFWVEVLEPKPTGLHGYDTGDER
jgi:hypothetical protein